VKVVQDRASWMEAIKSVPVSTVEVQFVVELANRSSKVLELYLWEYRNIC